MRIISVHSSNEHKVFDIYLGIVKLENIIIYPYLDIWNELGGEAKKIRFLKHNNVVYTYGSIGDRPIYI
jgi:hypothetical protein